MRRFELIFVMLLIVIVFLPSISLSNENDLLRALLKVKYSGDNTVTANECISYYRLGLDIFQQGASMIKSGQGKPNTDISVAESALKAKQSGNACVEQLLQMQR
jgi:hypothetical protein